MSAADQRLLAVVGPTASGKSALALELAQQLDGELICADSRTIYRGMDIGTAKPTAADQVLVPHHLLDICEPNQPYSAAEFKRAVTEVIGGIHGRNRLPILVGGTGLYLNAVLYNYQFPAGPSSASRTELEPLPLTELAQRLEAQDPERAAAIDLNNPRRVIRALELVGQPRVAPKALSPTIYILGLNPAMPELERRIAVRTHRMIAAGLVDEVRTLTERFSSALEPFNTVGYRESIQFLQGRLAEAELEPSINLHTRQLAKRQLTWFTRNPDINWFADSRAAFAAAKAFRAKAV